jgi:hypothetical protein
MYWIDIEFSSNLFVVHVILNIAFCYAVFFNGSSHDWKEAQSPRTEKHHQL